MFKKESAVVAAILKGAAPGVIDNFLSRGSDPNHSSNSNHHLALGSLQSKVPECWNFEPNERPSSSSILRVFADWEKSNPSSAFPTCAVGEVSGAGYIDDDDEDEDYDDLPSVGMCSVANFVEHFIPASLIVFWYCRMTMTRSMLVVLIEETHYAW